MGIHGGTGGVEAVKGDITLQRRINTARKQIAALQECIHDAMNLITALQLAIELYELYHDGKESKWLLDKTSGEVESFLKNMGRKEN